MLFCLNSTGEDFQGKNGGQTDTTKEMREERKRVVETIIEAKRSRVVEEQGEAPEVCNDLETK